MEAECAEEKTPQNSKRFFLGGILITVLLPITILLLNMLGTGFLLVKLPVVTEGDWFLFGIFFVPLILIATPIFFCLIHICPLKFKTRVIINNAISILITVPVILFTVADTEQYVLKRIPLKNGYQCRIYVDSFRDPLGSLYYEIRQGGDVKVRMTDYDSVMDTKGYEFRAIYADNDTVFGVIQISEYSKDLIVIYDSKINKSWPRSEAIEEMSNAFRVLKNENPEMPHPSYFGNN